MSRFERLCPRLAAGRGEPVGDRAQASRGGGGLAACGQESALGVQKIKEQGRISVPVLYQESSLYSVNPRISAPPTACASVSASPSTVTEMSTATSGSM